MSCVPVSVNEFYIFRQCPYMCVFCNVKKPKTTAKLSEKSGNKSYGVLYEVRACIRKAISWSVTVYFTKTNYLVNVICLLK